MTGERQYNDCAVIATDRRILLCSLSFTGAVDGHIADVDRTTQIGPAHGVLQYWTEALGPYLGIHRRFFKDVAKADAAMATARVVPPALAGQPRSAVTAPESPALAGWYDDPAGSGRRRECNAPGFGGR
jgi:hypothetical protein